MSDAQSTFTFRPGRLWHIAHNRLLTEATDEWKVAQRWLVIIQLSRLVALDSMSQLVPRRRFTKHTNRWDVAWRLRTTASRWNSPQPKKHSRLLLITSSRPYVLTDSALCNLVP